MLIGHFNAIDISTGKLSLPSIERLLESQTRIVKWMVWYTFLSKTDT